MTTCTVYSADRAIGEFFNSSTTATRLQCDGFAVSHAGGVATSLAMQGVCSYTVTAGPNKSKIFQFRDEDSALNMDHITLAKATHPDFVASCKYHGTIGDLRPLHVYEMETLSGISQIIAGIPRDDISRQKNNVIDFTKFFAQSWNNSQQLGSDEIGTLLAEFQSNFDLLTQHLPPRFKANLVKVHKALPSLFSKAFPFCLSHGDLNMMNVLVNPETGNITGVVDWAEAKVLPFGFALYGVEHLFGWMDSKGWHYYVHYRQLENLFWRTFQKEAHNFSDADLHLVSATRMAGIFYHYGFKFDLQGAVQGVRTEQDHSIDYLDAFCTASEWSPFL